MILHGCVRYQFHTNNKARFPQSCNFSVRTQVHFTRVNKTETLYGRSRVYVKVEPRLNFTFTSSLSYIASNHLRTFALKNYATVEINPKRRLGMSQNGHNQWQSKICQKIRKSCKNFVQLVIRPSKLI